jgi:hypothetical protein
VHAFEEWSKSTEAVPYQVVSRDGAPLYGNLKARVREGDDRTRLDVQSAEGVVLQLEGELHASVILQYMKNGDNLLLWWLYLSVAVLADAERVFLLGRVRISLEIDRGGQSDLEIPRSEFLT